MLLKKRVVVGSLAAVVLLLLAGALTAWLYYSRVAGPMEEARDAFLRRDWAQAGQAYQQARQALDGSRWLRVLLERDSHDALIGEAEALYATAKYEEAISLLNQEADRSAAFSQDPRRLLWSGNLWFQLAVAEGEDAERREKLNAAVDFYRKGLEAAPEHWELKFNFELASLVLAQESPLAREEREEEKKKRLLPRIRTDQQRQRRVLPPEERG